MIKHRSELPVSAINISLDDMEGEVWKDIPIYNGEYSVSNIGRVKSKSRMVYQPQHSRFAKRRERILRQKISVHGYMVVTMQVDGVKYHSGVHKLMAMAFIKNPENKCCINHIDGVKYNNVLQNLEWATISENQLHATRILGKGIGETNGRAVLSEKDVNEIRSIAKTKKRLPLNNLCNRYNIGKSTIRRIVTNQSWKHIL